ncbi:Coronin-B [Portunus trituberculatus]|uniref:Coronin-B n=1 Tax=Portunus trituberculatus TaxID=210409 RepID=A0A5B7GEY3_PORTR|nr:Coronin-B [Portunus trituberculatus]
MEERIGVFGGTVQTKGACLVPKRGLDVMNAEVNKILQLTSNSLIPITYQVPRKVRGGEKRERERERWREKWGVGR